jgi:hypothetical protein
MVLNRTISGQFVIAAGAAGVSCRVGQERGLGRGERGDNCGVWVGAVDGGFW